MSFSRTDSSPEAQRSGAAGVLLGYESSCFNHARYDSYNRLNSFTEAGSSANQPYGYDNLGNRWVITGVNPNYTAQTPTGNNFTNNQWAPGAGVTYDLAGNQTSIYLGAGGTRTRDRH